MSAYAFRKGLLRELAEVFASAEEMVGGTWPPDEMDDERERIRKLHREVVRVMRGGSDTTAARIHGAVSAVREKRKKGAAS